MRFRLALRLQRLAHDIRRRTPVLAVPVAAVYRFYALFLLGIDIPVSTHLGRGVRIYHGYGLVIHPNAWIGDDVVLRHGTTVGATGSEPDAPAPRIEEGADIGANAVIIGDITVGAQARIGAGAVVVRSVPPHRAAVGNPARLLEK